MSESESVCDGLCVTGADIGIPGPGVAYPHPSCPEHAPDAVCQCGMPDRCLSPTHGQIGMREALEVRHRQAPVENRCICPDLLDGRQVADCMIHGWSTSRLATELPWDAPPEPRYLGTLGPDELED